MLRLLSEREGVGVQALNGVGHPVRVQAMVRRRALSLNDGALAICFDVVCRRA